MDKYENRPGSIFFKAMGNPASKRQGQFHLNDILTSPGSITKPHGQKGIKVYNPDGRGAYFTNEGTFKGYDAEKLRDKLLKRRIFPWICRRKKPRKKAEKIQSMLK